MIFSTITSIDNYLHLGDRYRLLLLCMSNFVSWTSSCNWQASRVIQ